MVQELGKVSDSFVNIAQDANNTSLGFSKAEKIIVKSLEEINKKATLSNFDKLGEKAFHLDSILGILKKFYAPLQRIFQAVTDIGRQAKSLGTTAQHFQQLQQAASACGAPMQEVEGVFKSIQATAQKALSGDAGAIKGLKRLGVSVDDLRDKNPQQIFEIVAGAISRMGDSAEAQQAKIAVCGEGIAKIGENIGALSNASTITGQFISDDTVAAAESLSKSFDNIIKSIIAIGANSGIFKLIEKLADKLGAVAEGLKALNEDDTPEGPLWNNTMVDPETRRKALEYDRQWINDAQKKADEEYDRWSKASSASYQPVFANGGFGMPTPPAPPKRKFTAADLPIDEETGLTPGEMKYRWSPENPTGFKNATDTAPIKPPEIEAKKAEIEEREKKAAEEEKRRQEAADEEKAARNTKINDEIAYAKMTPEQRRIADFEKQLKSQLEKLTKDGATEAQLKEYEDARRGEFQAQLRRETNERIQRALAERQRQFDASRRRTESDHEANAVVKQAKKSKRKSREVGEAAPLSTAGSISDPKAARAQRRHELQLVREAARQKITVKVKPVKGAVIRNAVSTAVGGSLKQLAAAVERLSRQTYIVS